MGYYLNPTKGFVTKEGLLLEHGTVIEQPTDLKNVSPEDAIVIIVDNGLFTAAAFMFNEQELKAWQNDRRRHKWYKIKRDKLKEACPDLIEVLNNHPYPA